MPAPGRWILVSLLAVAAGFAAYLVSRSWLQQDTSATTAASSVLDAPGAVIPERRPDVTLADRDGKLRSLSEWDGRPQIINFWATWCAPCRREIPMLNAMARDPALADFALIGIAIDFREDVLKFLIDTPIEYTLLIGEQDGLDASRAFGMQSLGLPYTAFVDKAGRIVTIHLGELHRPQADVILSTVRALDAGEIDLRTAQDRIRAQVPKIG
jgi:thiol-disulfide isomerase/thioredoxin